MKMIQKRTTRLHSNSDDSTFKNETVAPRIHSTRWGIYHQEREFAREVGDPCLGVVSARTKGEAESEARWQGISGPTGIWAHPLPEETRRRA